ncbi:hypothetical protein ACFO3J_08180 [Streptomyces polygonati]|uniref:Uncharacterized protein n=1 Tax=Streptomyces polygonati TaxID=1617087 RepID=A0ABV8HMD3_9ACTN
MTATGADASTQDAAAHDATAQDTAARDIEDLLADLQLERSGLSGRGPDPAAGRAARLSGGIARLGLSRFVAELLGDGPPVPATVAVLDLEADEAGRRASYRIWRAEARSAAEEVWRWLTERRRTAGDRPWWCGESALPLPADSVRRLAAVTAPVTDLAPIAESWGRTAGLGDGVEEYNWRWLMLGKGLLGPSAGAALPGLDTLLGRLVEQARGHGLLPAAHRVGLIRRPNTPSMVMPVRLPGHSLLSLPTAVTPVTVQYLQHEIAHLAEHAARPAAAPLAARWSFDPLRSEGWALLLEHLVTTPEPLVRLGLDEGSAAAVAGFLAEEERFSRGLMAADLALEAELGGCRGAAGALEAAAAVIGRTGLRWAPELLLMRQPRMLHWRSYLAGYAWRDTVLAGLTSRFGAGWAGRDDAWAALLRALASTGSAGAFLRSLTAPPNSPTPDPTRSPDDRRPEHQGTTGPVGGSTPARP